MGSTYRCYGQFRSYNRHEEKKNRLVLSVFARELEFCRRGRRQGKEQPDFSGRLHLQDAGLPENTAWKRDCGSSACGQPALWQVGLHSVYLLGKKCQIYRPGLRLADTCRSGGASRAASTSKSWMRRRAEKRIAYEVSVSKLELIE